MVLRDYQENAVDFLYEHDRAMILAPVGAGKTAIALTAMQEMINDGHAKRFLVVAPKRVCTDVWPQEAVKWCSLTLAVAVGTPTQRLENLNSDADIVVINYDNLQWLAEQVLNFDAVVFDELTRLKNASGKRFKALNKVMDMPIRWGLTGSFTSNGLEDTFGQCKIIDPRLLGRSKGAFLQEYFWLSNPDYHIWEPREGSLEKVMARIKPATFLLEAKDYADTLPPLHMVELRCELEDRKPYEDMKKDFVSLGAVAVNAGVVTGKLQQLANGFVYTPAPVWFSHHKFDLLEELLSENQRAPTLVWYWFEEELAELKRRYPHAVEVEGNIEAWNAGKVSLMLAHPASAGHGINLQGQNKMVFLTLPWSLELFEQAVGRLHRGGQKQEVWCYVLLTNGTVDDKVWAALKSKADMSILAKQVLMEIA